MMSCTGMLIDYFHCINLTVNKVVSNFQLTESSQASHANSIQPTKCSISQVQITNNDDDYDYDNNLKNASFRSYSCFITVVACGFGE